MTSHRPWRWIVLTGVCCAWLCGPVRAHFLFVRILPPAEGGRAAEVYFSEKADAGDPRYIDKVAATRLWLQTGAGEPRELVVTKGADRLRAHLPIHGCRDLRHPRLWSARTPGADAVSVAALS